MLDTQCYLWTLEGNYHDLQNTHLYCFCLPN